MNSGSLMSSQGNSSPLVAISSGSSSGKITTAASSNVQSERSRDQGHCKQQCNQEVQTGDLSYIPLKGLTNAAQREVKNIAVKTKIVSAIAWALVHEAKWPPFSFS